MTPEDQNDGAADDTVLEVSEEQLVVGIHQSVTGRVRISTTTDTIDRIVRQELETTRAEVVRVPIDRTLEVGESPPAPRVEGAVTIIPIFEEILVMETRLHLKEEVHVTTYATLEEIEVPVALRRQQAIVEQVAEESPQDHTPQNPAKE